MLGLGPVFRSEESIKEALLLCFRFICRGSSFLLSFSSLILEEAGDFHSQVMLLMLHFFLFFPRLAGFSVFFDGARFASGSTPSDNSLAIPWISSLRYST